MVTRPVEPGKESELTRDDISCKLIYAANGRFPRKINWYAIILLSNVVNPGGWAPAAVVRTIAKREICKFIKTFSASAHEKASSTPLTL